MDVNKRIEQICSSAEIAVDELLKVAEEEILTGTDNDLSADRLKNAAATKKLAIFDALDIVQRVKEEKEKLLAALEEEEKDSKEDSKKEKPKKKVFGSVEERISGSK